MFHMTRLTEDALKLIGAPPYHGSGAWSIIRGDFWFNRQCATRHGEERWTAEVERVLALWSAHADAFDPKEDEAAAQ